MSSSEANPGSEPTQPGPLARVWSFLRHQGAFIVCIVLHLLLIGAHVALIVVKYDHNQHLARDTLATDLIFLAIVMIPGVIIKQSLSALHEKSAAWLGLGSALTGMWRQRQHRAAPLDILCILLYLSCLFGLGITTPALINVGYADINDPLLAYMTNYLNGVTVDGIEQGFPIVSMLPLLWYNVATIGYQDSTVYDIPNVGGRGKLSVSGVRFNATCRSLPSLRQTGDPHIISVPGSSAAALVYPLHIDDSIQDVDISPALGSLRIVSAQGISDENSPPTLFVVASGIQITNDPLNDTDTPVTMSSTALDPPVILDPTTCGGDCGQINVIQVLACDVQAINQTVMIDANNGDLLADSSWQPTQWESWSPPPAPFEAFLQQVGEFGSLSPLTDRPQEIGVNLGSQTLLGVSNSTLLEANIVDFLRLWDSETFPTITLGDLGYALQQAIAMIYWRAAFQNGLQEPHQGNRNFVGYQVQINKYTPWMGLGISVLLFFLAMVLTRHPSAASRELESIGSPGVLQLTWLMGRAPHIAQELAGVEMPNSDALLSKGKNISVHMKAHIEDKDPRGPAALDGIPELTGLTDGNGGPTEEEKPRSVV